MTTKSKAKTPVKKAAAATKQNQVSDTVLGSAAVASKNDVDKEAQAAVEGADDQKGYGGTGDLASGKVYGDPSQATPEEIKEKS